MLLYTTVDPPPPAPPPLQYRRSMDWKKPAVLENGGKGSHLYNQEKNIQYLKISGSIRGEAVNGGEVLRGATVLLSSGSTL